MKALTLRPHWARLVVNCYIHEFGHEYSGDHLSSDYHEALCRLGAGLKKLALERPEAMKHFLR